MAMIRTKKKQFVTACLIGMLICGIPFGIAGGALLHRHGVLKQELARLQKEKEAEHIYTAYSFREDKNRGDCIMAGDLEQIDLVSGEVLQFPKRGELEGKYLSAGAKAGIIITDPMLLSEVQIQDDIRTYYYDYITLPQGIGAGQIFDIRIRFPDGEDYVIAVGKRAERVMEAGAFINADEKENLMLASAYADMTVYEGTKIYAALYTSDYQQAVAVDYPCNLYTNTLATWDPNLLQKMDTEENRRNRQILEGNLFDFMGVTMGGAGTQTIQSVTESPADISTE